MYYLLADRGGRVTFHLRQEFVPLPVALSRAAGYSNARLRLAATPEIYWRFQFCVSRSRVRAPSPDGVCESVGEIMGDGSGLCSLNQDAENAF
jgi:hypothetical protein